MTDGEVRFREFESEDGLAGEVDAATCRGPNSEAGAVLASGDG
jgi:hypothetical protein